MTASRWFVAFVAVHRSGLDRGLDHTAGWAARDKQISEFMR
ncbi:MAG: hypothetical protein WCF16_11495 [Alphaproteobacteria bacterium]